MLVRWDMCVCRSMTLMSRVSVRGPWCRDAMRLTRSIVTREATTVVALVRHLLRHLHRPRCLPTTGHLQQCAEKRSCEGRDLSERVTFCSQSTDGQEERLEMNMKWSTQCRFFHVAYNLAQIALYQFVILDWCRVSPRHRSRSAPWSCLSDV